MNFCGFTIDSPVFLAPMAGFTDSIYRAICRGMGAGLVFTEMVSAEGLIRDSANTLRYIRFNDNERHLGIQLFGACPSSMAGATGIINRFHPDIIDINCGCPVLKVVKKGAGSALLKDLKKMEAVVKAVLSSTDIPVTVKMRSGWSSDTIVAVEAAQMLESIGVSAVIIHPRTRGMLFSGCSDWNIIREIRQNIKIPVVGNGDVKDLGSAKRMFCETGCEYIMIGRAAMGNPWLFAEINAYLNGTGYKAPSLSQKTELIIRHLTVKVREQGESFAVKEMKRHLSCYTKGFKGGAGLRQALMRSVSKDGMIRILHSYLHNSLCESETGRPEMNQVQPLNTFNIC